MFWFVVYVFYGQAMLAPVEPYRVHAVFEPTAVACESTRRDLEQVYFMRGDIFALTPCMAHDVPETPNYLEKP